MLKTLQLVLLLSAFAQAAVVRGTIPLRSFDSVIGIQRDGSVVVVERFVPSWPRQSVVWRTSTDYPGTWGIRDPRVVEILQVTTGEGQPLNYEVHRRSGWLELNIEAAAAKEIRLAYAVRNDVHFLDDRDELQWTPGDGWRGDTQKATVFVQVPPELAGVVRTQASLPGHGLLPLRPTEVGPDRVWFETNGPIGQSEPLLVDVVLPKGELREPALTKRISWFVRANAIVLLPLMTLVFMLLLRSWKHLPEVRDYTVAAQYEPPEGLTPAEVGLLIDDKLDPRDVTATFIDLAVRGYIRLEPCQADDGVEFDGHDFKLVSLHPKDDWYALPLHERTLLFHTFYGGEWTKLSSLTLRFHTVVPLMRRHVVQLLRCNGMYWTDPDYSQSARLSLLGIFFVAALAIQLFGIFSFASSWLLSLLAVGASALIVHYFGRGITSKTRKGLRTYEHILGFEHFLDTVERDRLERLPVGLFEKWLPYAMALGVESHWAKNFEGVATAPPEWMQGIEDAVFDTNGLVRVLATIARESASSGLTLAF